MLLRYTVGRAFYAVAVVWAAFTLSFVLLYLLPGDPISIMLSGRTSGGDAGVAETEAQRAALSARYGFDQPVITQYFRLLGSALHGDFGVSMQSGETVTRAVSQVLPGTLAVTGLGLLVAVVAGVAVAVAATLTNSRVIRFVLESIPAVALAVPTFWIGLILLQIFAFKLRLVPSIGNNGTVSVILPAVVVAIPSAALFAKVLTSSLDKTLAEPYIAVVDAKGVSAVRTHLVHALRNAMLPVLTLIGMAVGGLVAGAVVTETVFSRAGVGRLLQLSVTTQDIPVVQAIVVLSAVLFASVNLFVDLLYPLVDPRIRLSAR